MAFNPMDLELFLLFTNHLMFLKFTLAFFPMSEQLYHRYEWPGFCSTEKKSSRITHLFTKMKPSLIFQRRISGLSFALLYFHHIIPHKLSFISMLICKTFNLQYLEERCILSFTLVQKMQIRIISCKNFQI